MLDSSTLIQEQASPMPSSSMSQLCNHHLRTVSGRDKLCKLLYVHRCPVESGLCSKHVLSLSLIDIDKSSGLNSLPEEDVCFSKQASLPGSHDNQISMPQNNLCGMTFCNSRMAMKQYCLCQEQHHSLLASIPSAAFSSYSSRHSQLGDEPDWFLWPTSAHRKDKSRTSISVCSNNLQRHAVETANTTAETPLVVRVHLISNEVRLQLRRSTAGCRTGIPANYQQTQTRDCYIVRQHSPKDDYSSQDVNEWPVVVDVQALRKCK